MTPRTTDPPSDSATAVLGLGPMGTALARALLASGRPVTVWNRTAARAEALAAGGATVAATAAEAVESADLIVVCVRDHSAVVDVLGELESASLEGRVVLNVATATPDEARSTAAWAGERDLTYLTGAIMVPTPMIGEPEALVLYAGEAEAFERVADRLRVFAGSADHLGDDHGQPSVLDLAMLTIFFAGMTSYLQAAAMVTAQGGDAAGFQQYAGQIVDVLAAELPGLAQGVDSANHSGDQDNLAMELRALEHIVEANHQLELDPRLPTALRDVTRASVDAGHGADGFTRVIDVLRRRAA